MSTDPTLPATDASTPAPEPLPVAESITEHAATFSPEAQETIAQSDADAPPNETPAQAQQRRDKATGQFREGKTRHRAKSQQASPEDVPRIRELTARAKAAEERAAAYERQQQQPPPHSQVSQTQAPAPVMAPPPRQVPAPFVFNEPEPKLDDFVGKHDDPYGAHIRASAKWELRKENFDAQVAQYQQQQQWAEAQKTHAFIQRMHAATQKYPDYTSVAFAPTPIQPGSIVDTFIREDDAGAEMLYYLHTHREELATLLTGDALKQARHLSLLSQRLLADSPAAADSNGAAPRLSTVVLPPKPSTPLRTEAQRAAPTAPPTDGSLSIREHAKAFGPKR